MSAKSPLTLKLFYCYAREDKANRDKLDQHLAELKRKYHITCWPDQETVSEKAIATYLNTADVILLLVSSHFMASNYCYSVEMERALARHEEGTALVIPILLHRIYLGNAPFEKLQMLPTKAKPVSRWAKRDEAFWNVTSEIARAIDELVKSWPSKEEWNRKGNDLRDRNCFEDALVAYEQALRLDSSYTFAWYNKGNTLVKLKRFEEGLAAYEQALQLDPYDTFAWNEKGRILFTLERFEEALTAYDQALKLDPLFNLAWYNRGCTLLELKRFADALAAYKQTDLFLMPIC